ncbi:MAG: tetrahydromethanopterin S-methyltransferase subunit A [Candidatus Thorarchaeota archaeon]|jgi:tetrahydromethanopterin S-methyltransferase subunit A
MSGNAWPHVPGDFEVGDPSGSVAICTLGKKFPVPGSYAIIGTCKTENIGIERVIINIISNPSIRFLILSGPEVPGHLTGSSMKSLYENGVDPDTRRIKDAPGAIPYIENVPLEGVERFRHQVEFVDLMNNSRAEEIAAKAAELHARNPGLFSGDPMFIDFRGASSSTQRIGIGGSITLLPEFGVSLNPFSFLVGPQETSALISAHPSSIGIEVQSSESGTILIGKEL